MESDQRDIQDLLTERDSVSQIGSVKSRTSSVASALLVSQQRKAELLAKARSLKRKQELQLAKLKLNQEEDALDLETELETSEAQTRLLQEFGRSQDHGSSLSGNSERSDIVTHRTARDRNAGDGLAILAMAAEQAATHSQGYHMQPGQPAAQADLIQLADMIPIPPSQVDNPVLKPEPHVRSDQADQAAAHQAAADQAAGHSRTVFTHKQFTLDGIAGEAERSGSSSQDIAKHMEHHGDVNSNSRLININNDSNLMHSEVPAVSVNHASSGLNVHASSGLNVHANKFLPGHFDRHESVNDRSKYSVTCEPDVQGFRSNSTNPPHITNDTNPFSTNVPQNDMFTDGLVTGVNFTDGLVTGVNSGVGHLGSGKGVNFGAGHLGTGSGKGVNSGVGHLGFGKGANSGVGHLGFDKGANSGVDPLRSNKGVNSSSGPLGSGAQNVSNGSMHITPKGVTGNISQPNDLIVSMLHQMRKPDVDIKKFSGDPLEYHQFIRQFYSKIVANCESYEELMTYLEQFTAGEANKIVRGFSYLDAEIGYETALGELGDRYGNKEVVATAFIKRALEWPPVSGDRPKALDRYSIFLCECDNAVKSIDAVKVLEYPDNLRKLVGKLPAFLHERWRNIVDKKRDIGAPITFNLLASFVKQEAKKANDPVYGREALSSNYKPFPTGKQHGQHPPVSSKVKASFATVETRDNAASSEAKQHKNGQTKPCIFCEGSSHALLECQKLAAKEYQERVDFLKGLGLCYGCLKSGHPKRSCKTKATCTRCQGKHPTVLHNDKFVKRNQTASSGKVDDQVENQPLVTSNCAEVNTACSNKDSHAGVTEECTMAIIPVKIKAQNGIKVIETYAFLDTGSSVSFCTEKLMHQLGASGDRKRITIDTMGESHTMYSYLLHGLEVCDLELENVIKLPQVYTKSVMPVSHGHIPTMADVAHWDHLKDICLPQLPPGTEVGLLIGNNVPDAYAPLEIRTGPRGSPHASRTLLGWILWNVVREVSSQSGLSCEPTVNRAGVADIERVSEFQKLDQLVRQSFDLDFPERALDDKPEYSQEDKDFIQKVNSSLKIEDGHYKINLPFRKTDVKLPNNKQQAVQRLQGLERKFKKNPKFYEDYTEFMAKILDKGYAEQVPLNDLKRDDGKVWYIPHHGVYHPRKPEKIRVVFDCSATYLGVSLNSLLLPGPNLTNNLIGVLQRFREDQIALMADIEAMYYQVRVPKEDCDCLRFLWWPNGDINATPVAFRMAVHLFGAVSSPSCSNMALLQTGVDNQSLYGSRVTEVIRKHFYVDDCLKSVRTEDEAISLIKDLSDLCQRGGFHLTKWISNSRNVIASVPEDEQAKELKNLDLVKSELPAERALGVYWSAESDMFGFKVASQIRKPTRRTVLSVVSSIYDPLGFVSPYVLTAKMLLQELCQSKMEWDEELQGKNMQLWQGWLSDITELEKFQIPRCFKPLEFGIVTSCQLHTFSDASETGYGAVSYLRLVDDKGKIHCCFLMSKARVAPLKKVTVPRMELTAASVGVKLTQMLIRELEIPISSIYYWTDSQSVLRYLANESTRFHTFVANRISVIREVSNIDQWKYVKTDQNPADAASRGLPMRALLQNKLWFRGPDFLWEPEDQWPTTAHRIDRNLLQNDPEVKGKVNASIVSSSNGFMDRMLKHFSSWIKLKKAVAWMQLALKNLKGWVLKRKEIKERIASTETDPEKVQQVTKAEMSNFKTKEMKEASKRLKSVGLTVDLLQQAERTVIQHVQHQHFGEEIKCLESATGNDSPKLKRVSSVYKLDPIVVDGILRVGGRLDRANIPYDARHPILLPKESIVSDLILQDVHTFVGHLGRNSMVSELRQKYWLPSAPSAVRKFISRCVICRKQKAKAEEQKMADLPEDRVTVGEPAFTRVGMDYFGPLEIKRGRSTIKRYGVVFTCLTSRAVHLEVASSLDTNSCINAVRRFTSRRGPVKIMRSDNGTNIVGAEREMKEQIDKWNKGKICETLLKKNIQWVFNPPGASHFGGVWERIIRSVRKILYSLMQQQTIKLDDEGLQTLFCEIESILNGRPIAHISDDPKDLEPLTPNHLLMNKPGETGPPGKFVKEDNYATRRWRQIQYLANVFWSRWVKEYLPLIQERQKWTNVKRNVEIGDVVLIMDNTPRNSWCMGKVIQIIKDRKGLVRSAKVKTKSSELERPISKLCLVLESQSET